MSSHIRGYMSEDLEPRIVSGPPRYTSRTDKAVEYIALADQQDQVIGYIYANDEDDAAGWVLRPAAGVMATNLAAPWVRMLLDAKKRGLKPSAALDELIRAGTDYATAPRTHAVANSRASAASLTALQAYAAQ